MALRIGRVCVDGDLVLAPMASVTNPPFRRICLDHGCSLAVTEMVSSEAVVRTRRKALPRMARAAGESVLVVQLFGARPEVVGEAAAVAVEHAGADVVDINMGCPVRKVLSAGAGVALMRDPERAESIVRAVTRAVGDVPVTVKMRAGWDDTSLNAVELARRLEQAGASGITVHARTKLQGHTGEPTWGVISAVRQAVSIAVIGNGGVGGRADARRMRKLTGCDAVMIGRAALGNPWVFLPAAGHEPFVPSIAQRFEVVRRHVALYVEHVGEDVAVREMRKHLCWYVRGLPASASVRSQLQAMNSTRAMLSVVDAYEGTLRAAAKDAATFAAACAGE